MEEMMRILICTRVFVNCLQKCGRRRKLLIYLKLFSRFSFSLNIAGCTTMFDPIVHFEFGALIQ